MRRACSTFLPCPIPRHGGFDVNGFRYIHLVSIILAALLLAGTKQDYDPADTWAFAPAEDRFTDEALLDLRSLNEKEISGIFRFIKAAKAGPATP